MTGSQMLTEVRKILEDPDGMRFSDEDIYNSLTSAELKLAVLIDKAYLTELRYVDTDLTFTNGKCPVSSLSKTILNGQDGLITVKSSAGYYARVLDIKNLTDLNNTYTQPITDVFPACYILNDNIYIHPTTITQGDVFYYRVPLGISGSQSSILNSVLHPLIINYASAELLAIDEKPTKSQILEERTNMSIKTLNTIIVERKLERL